MKPAGMVDQLSQVLLHLRVNLLSFYLVRNLLKKSDKKNAELSTCRAARPTEGCPAATWLCIRRVALLRYPSWASLGSSCMSVFRWGWEEKTFWSPQHREGDHPLNVVLEVLAHPLAHVLSLQWLTFNWGIILTDLISGFVKYINRFVAFVWWYFCARLRSYFHVNAVPM